MVKTPKTRHSKQRRDPVTIDLGPGDVSRVTEANPAGESESARPEAVSENPFDAAPAAEAPAAKPADAEETSAEAAVDDDRNVLDEDVRARTHAEPRYAAGFGRSPLENDEIKDPEEPQPGPQRVAGRGAAIAAGLAGGVIALAGAGLLQFAGLLPSPGSVGSPNAAAVQVEIDALRQEIDRLKNTPAAAEGLDGLTATVDQLKSDIATLRSAVETGGAGEGAAVQALDTKLKEIEATVATLGAKEGGTSAAELDGLNQKISALQSAIDATSKAGTDMGGRLAAVEQSIAGLSQKVEAQADQPRIALAIAASGLKAAVDRGGTFAAELETLAAVAPNAPELAELRTLAEKGVPSRADLVAAAPAAATAMIDASTVVDDNAGFLDRLMTSAESLVKVRPVGVVEGEGVPEKTARMEAALKDGDLAKALAEYDTLPEPSKAAGAAFADTVRSRLKAEELVDKALAGALKAG
jgi:hypothetical protein